MATKNGVSFFELPDSPNYTIDDRGVHAERKFRVGWSDRFAFAEFLFGCWRNEAGSYRLTQPPLALPGFPSSFVTNCTIRPLGGADDKPTDANSLVGIDSGSEVSAYEWAIITAQYETNYAYNATQYGPTFAAEIETAKRAYTYVTIEADFGGEVFQPPVGAFKWSVDSVQVNTDYHPALTIPSANYTVCWFWVPDPPWSSIRQTIGCVNDATFLGYPAGCVLFTGFQPVPMLRVQGASNNSTEVVLYKMIYRFAAQSKLQADGTTSVGWNYLWRDGASGATSAKPWQLIEDDTTAGKYMHPIKSFATLFQFAS